MITVAKNIDAPIKLVFQTAKGTSILGLGDIVVPGMLMALALRFDLFQHYQRQTTLEPVQLTTTTSTASTATVTTQHRRIKAPYVDTRGQWGNRFWTTRPFHLTPTASATEPLSATAFPKPYFYASIVGYAAGMLATLAVLLVSNHGQPALLYLVPGVVGALWATGWWRGEVGEMWGYTEDGSLDVEDVVVEVDGEGRVVGEEKEGKKEGEEKKEAGEKREVGEDEKKEEAEAGGQEQAQRHRAGFRELFVFSIAAPRAIVAVE